MNKEIVAMVNILHSIKKQEWKEKHLEAYVNKIRQEAYYTGYRRAQEGRKP